MSEPQAVQAKEHGWNALVWPDNWPDHVMAAEFRSWVEDGLTRFKPPMVLKKGKNIPAKKEGKRKLTQMVVTLATELVP